MTSALQGGWMCDLFQDLQNIKQSLMPAVPPHPGASSGEALVEEVGDERISQSIARKLRVYIS